MKRALVVLGTRAWRSWILPFLEDPRFLTEVIHGPPEGVRPGWFDAAVACLIAAAGGLLVAAVAGRIVYKTERRERHRRVAQAQLETARDRAEAKAATPEKERGFALAEKREMRESREIQASLLPRTIPNVDHYHLDVDYRPCGVLGGDFYDFRCCEDGSILMTVGDVSGKGPAGAIVMAMVQTLFRDHADRAAGPADLLYRVNTGFAGALGKGIFVTALAGWPPPSPKVAAQEKGARIQHQRNALSRCVRRPINAARQWRECSCRSQV